MLRTQLSLSAFEDAAQPGLGLGEGAAGLEDVGEPRGVVAVLGWMETIGGVVKNCRTL